MGRKCCCGNSVPPSFGCESCGCLPRDKSFDDYDWIIIVRGALFPLTYGPLPNMDKWSLSIQTYTEDQKPFLQSDDFIGIVDNLSPQIDGVYRPGSNIFCTNEDMLLDAGNFECFDSSLLDNSTVNIISKDIFRYYNIFFLKFIMTEYNGSTYAPIYFLRRGPSYNNPSGVEYCEMGPSDYPYDQLYYGGGGGIGAPGAGVGYVVERAGNSYPQRRCCPSPDTLDRSEYCECMESFPVGGGEHLDGGYEWTDSDAIYQMSPVAVTFNGYNYQNINPLPYSIRLDYPFGDCFFGSVLYPDGDPSYNPPGEYPVCGSSLSGTYIVPCGEGRTYYTYGYRCATGSVYAPRQYSYLYVSLNISHNGQFVDVGMQSGIANYAIDDLGNLPTPGIIYESQDGGLGGSRLQAWGFATWHSHLIYNDCYSRWGCRLADEGEVYVIDSINNRSINPICGGSYEISAVR